MILFFAVSNHREGVPQQRDINISLQQPVIIHKQIKWNSRIQFEQCWHSHSHEELDLFFNLNAFSTMLG